MAADFNKRGSEEITLSLFLNESERCSELV